MDKESLRKQAAGRAAMELLLTADNARRTGRWAKGAEVLEQVAEDMVINAAKPEQRRTMRALRRLSSRKPLVNS
jgi:hypothetical protein